MIKVRASKCEIRNVSVDEEKSFLNLNHYQGYVPSIWSKGLYNGNELICLMSFGNSRYNKRYDWELLRLCTKKDYQVYGGASKLLKCFISENTGSIISYCNESKFSGKVYEVLGFTKIGTCNSYHYEKDGKSYHRSSFMKCICLKKWPEYVGKDITEKQIMTEKGYTRVEEIQATWVFNDDVKYYIYEIENHGYHYIGQHCYRKSTDDKYTGSGTIIKRVNAKYPDGINKTILKDGILTREEANELEIKAIAANKEIYGEMNINILPGGQNAISSTYRPFSSATYGFLGKHHTEETKKKITEAGKGKHDHRGINNPRYGKHWSDEQKVKLSEAHKGTTPWNKGIKRTDLQDTAVIYQKKDDGQKHTRLEWKELGFDVYYKKDLFVKLGRLRDQH